MPRRFQRGHVDQKITRKGVKYLYREKAHSYPRCRICGRKLAGVKRLRKHGRHKINRPYGDLCAKCAREQIALSLIRK